MMKHIWSLFLAFCTFGAVFAAQVAPAKTILIVGDSISAAYGLQTSEGWVALLQKKWDDEKRGIKLVNASVSGDTTANGRARLPALLSQHKPSAVVIALGGNDGLRGASPAAMRANLEAMASLSKTAKAKVAIIGIQMPPNVGPLYATQFENAFRDAAKKVNAPLLPSILAPLGTSLDDFQPDKIHPNAKAQVKLRAHIEPTIAALLK